MKYELWSSVSLMCLAPVVFLFSCMLVGCTSKVQVPLALPEHDGDTSSPLAKAIAVNLGTVSPDMRVSREVAFQNKSDISWTFDRSHSDCGCLVGEVEPKRIPSGSFGSFSFDYLVPSEPGAIERKVLLHFKEPGAPTLVFSIQGRSRNRVDFSPNIVDFGEVRPGSRVSRSVQVTLAEGETLNPDDAKITTSWLEILASTETPAETDRANPGPHLLFDLVASPPSNADAGVFEGECVFNHSKYGGLESDRAITLRFHGEITESWSLSPKSVFWGAVSPDGGAVKKCILIKSLISGSTVDLNSISVDTSHYKFLKARLVSGVGDNEAKIQIELLPDHISERYTSGVVTIRYQEEMEWDIPFSVKLLSDS